MIDGAQKAEVREALRSGDALSGADGFAGAIDGRLIRDVIGRYPVFSEADDPTSWSFDPTDLDDPDPVPAGHVRDGRGDTGRWALPDPEPREGDAAVLAVREAIVGSVDALEGEIPIAFSGGIDSSILAARLEGPLYVGGFEGSHDVAAARSAAERLGRDDLRVVEFSHDDIESKVPAVAEATGRTNPMDLHIALPLYLVAEAVAADGYDRLALGQGADELFGGYAKIANAPDDHRVAAETVRGATRESIDSLPRQLERDVLALRTAGVEPAVPLLSDRVIDAALRLPEELLVAGDERKVALRRAADFLPAEIRSRDKKALQYGSLLAREFDRLARRAGFKRRMGDHLERYVESLLPDRIDPKTEATDDVRGKH